MMEFILNPDNFKVEYLSYLNQCFPGWGDETTYEWVYRKHMDLASADIFVIKNENEEILAGSALTYRTIKFPDQTEYAMGTMTGSWTLPAARGQGCFTEIIRYSAQLIEQHHYDFLTAFVTEQNASYRRLKSEGSYLLNTSYVRSEVVSGMDVSADFEVLKSDFETLQYLFDLRNQLSSKSIHYSYDFDNFVTQFIERPNAQITILKFGEQYFILEETPQTFRIMYASSYDHHVIVQLVHWAGAKGKNIFFITTALNEAYRKDDCFTIIPGFLTILANTNKPLLDNEALFGNIEFNIQYGDKM